MTARPVGTAPSAVAVAVDAIVEAGAWAAPTGDRDRFEQLARSAVATAIALAQPSLAAGAEVSIVFADDAHIRALNRRFRHKDAPTNVLSFPAGPPLAGRYGPLLGDVVLAFETVAAEATEKGVPFDAYVSHMIVHGFLHLLGYDHETEQEAVAMEGLETAIMKDLGIADPYAE
jgi:probable rRNA maturation factor